MSYTRHSFVSRDGLTLSYRQYGNLASGPYPLLCLHGLTRNSADFHAMATVLQQQYGLVVPDVRGRGQSARDPNWKNYHPGIYNQDAWQLLDQLELDKVILIGTSMGGIMSMMMASEQPERIVGVVLNDIGPDLAPAGIMRIMSYVGDVTMEYSREQALERVKQLNQDFFPEYQEADWQTWVERTYREVGENRWVLDYDAGIIKALVEGAAAPIDMWPLFEALRGVPLMAIRGEQSDLLSVETLVAMEQRYPAMISCTVPRRGHAPMLDEPVAMTSLQDFLKTFDK